MRFRGGKLLLCPPPGSAPEGVSISTSRVRIYSLLSLGLDLYPPNQILNKENTYNNHQDKSKETK